MGAFSFLPRREGKARRTWGGGFYQMWVEPVLKNMFLLKGKFRERAEGK